MTPILILQHITCETPGILENLLVNRKIPYRIIRSDAGEEVPSDIADTPALIVMGGPMGVYEADKYPFLKHEMRLITSAVRMQRPVLGICLGSQLLAAALGAKVQKGPAKEIGWHPVSFSEDAGKDPLLSKTNGGTVLHWHGDIFDPPGNAVVLASSEQTPVQAYRYGRNAYGFLFHVEVTELMIRDWVREFAAELAAAQIDPEPILNGIPKYLPGLNAIGKRVLGNWVDLLPKPVGIQVTGPRPAEAR